MKASFLQEPELEFGYGKHIDIRFGISNYKPLDCLDQLAPKNIPIGMVGTEKTISEFRSWIEQSAAGIPAKVSDQPNLFPAFPGFGPDSPFESALVFDSRLERQVSTRNLPTSVNRKDYNAFLRELADTYIAEADAASEKGALVVVCALADQRILRLIQKWLKAGVSEDGEWSETKIGTPQGAVISPLLANIYLHYVFDTWVEAWQKKLADGDMIVVRYADDLVVGFQHRAEAERFLLEFAERLAKFGLELHRDKTRLIEFGRFAQANRQARGEEKPESFAFLGFTHSCGVNRKGYFTIHRHTVRKRLEAKLQQVKQTLRKRMHEPVARVGEWLGRVLRGFYQYHAVPGNTRALQRFRRRISWYWWQVLRRRSQRGRLTYARLDRLVARWLPRPRVLHPYPSARFGVTHPR